MAQQSNNTEVTLHTGDILIGNWITVVGRIGALGGQRYTHCGVVVNLDKDGLFAYDITNTSNNPITTPMEHYIENPLLSDLSVRQLKKPMSETDEERFKQVLCDHSVVSYPPLKSVLGKLGHSVKPEQPVAGQMVCSELVYSLFRRMEWVPPKDRVLGNLPLLPDNLLPGGIRDLDVRYEGQVKLIAKRNMTREQSMKLLQPQLLSLANLLA